MAKKPKIIIGIIVALALVGPATLYVFKGNFSKKYTNADFCVETYQSAVDRDGDGVDDQTDILSSVRSYLETQPKYKSIYYASGYPDDNHGVCTDVVAFGLLGAGYDLRELVDQDIQEKPSAYDVEIRDKNIDFRRVKNLATYFKNHAISLTTDLKDISAWQGGDIVVFKDHIGIISDQRNRRGVPFLIHHYSPFQMTYEEDVLEKYQNDPELQHYRMT